MCCTQLHYELTERGGGHKAKHFMTYHDVREPRAEGSPLQSGEDQRPQWPLLSTEAERRNTSGGRRQLRPVPDNGVVMVLQCYGILELLSHASVRGVLKCHSSRTLNQDFTHSTIEINQQKRKN